MLQVWSYGFTTSPTGQPELDSQLVGSSSTNGPGGGGWQQPSGQQVLVPGVSAAEREWGVQGVAGAWGVLQGYHQSSLGGRRAF